MIGDLSYAMIDQDNGKVITANIFTCTELNRICRSHNFVSYRLAYKSVFHKTSINFQFDTFSSRFPRL